MNKQLEHGSELMTDLKPRSMITDDLTQHIQKQADHIELMKQQIAQIDAEIASACQQIKHIEMQNSLLEAEITLERNKVVQMQARLILFEKEFSS